MDRFNLIRGSFLLELTPQERNLIVYILTFELMLLYKSEKEISKLLKISERQVKNILKSLHQKKLIKYHYRTGKRRVILLNVDLIEEEIKKAS